MITKFIQLTECDLAEHDLLEYPVWLPISSIFRIYIRDFGGSIIQVAGIPAQIAVNENPNQILTAIAKAEAGDDVMQNVTIASEEDKP